MRHGILSVIGNSPLIELTRVFAAVKFKVYGKLEALNPGGSMKDRPAVSMLERALATGTISQDAVIIESSSGNMGIGLAQACAYFDLKFICVVDSKTAIQNIRLLEAYGACVEIVSEPDPTTGEFLQARLERVAELVRTTKNGFWPNQYANLDNPRAHYQTMHEIVTALHSQVDYLFCPTSTCGTLRGCSEYISQHKLNIKLIAVDAQGSVIFGPSKGKRLIPGHGSSVHPPLFKNDLANEVVLIDDLGCIKGCRRLVRTEAILAGGSSGAVITAIEVFKDRIPEGSVCVALLADRGERYLDTIYSESWVEEHFGKTTHSWTDNAEEPLSVMAVP